MKDLSVLVLTGGESQRFGGKKALFKIDGKPMVQHTVERVSTLSSEVLISCKSGCRELTKMFPWAKVIRDKSRKKGALTGLVSSLPKINSEYVAIVACDCPRINPAAIKFLLKRARGHDAGIPRWPNGYIEPLQAVYKTEKLRRAAEEAWKDGKMKLYDVLKLMKDAVYVSTENLRKVDPKLKSFLNLNTPDEMDAF